MQTAMRVFEEIAPKLNLAEHPSVTNLPVDEVKNYLMRNHLKCCVLVVDAVSVKDAYELKVSVNKTTKNFSQQRRMKLVRL